MTKTLECKHDLKILSDIVTRSSTEHVGKASHMRIDALPRRRITVSVCTKCKKFKRNIKVMENLLYKEES